MVAKRRSLSSLGRSSIQRWLPGSITVAPFSGTKSSSAHIVLRITSSCGLGNG